MLNFYFPLAFQILKIDDIFKNTEVFNFFNQLISIMLDYNCAKFSQLQIETVQMMLLSMVNLPNLLCTYKVWPKQGDRKFVF